MLITLNPDLSNRIEELSVTRTAVELKQVFSKGCRKLNLRPPDAVATEFASISYESVGLLQKLALRFLDDELGIEESPADGSELVVDSVGKVADAAMHVAEQLNQLYQTFGKRVSEGIRTRSNSTGIYAHAMASIMAMPDAQLSTGLDAKVIYADAHKREPRILLNNLKLVLSKFADLQVDSEGRGLVLAYDSQGEIGSYVTEDLTQSHCGWMGTRMGDDIEVAELR
jgi:hypothetical protein